MPPSSNIVIPTAKTEYHPAQLMNIKESTPEGNADVVSHLLGQAGATNEQVTEHCVLVHGDLATIERLAAACFSRGPERTETNRMQFIVPIPGLFHFQMAATDALHRIYIAPPKCHTDSTSLLNHVGILRPKEVAKIRSSPIFRQMHDVIHHDTWARTLDCWRVVVKQQYPGCESLKQYSESEEVSWADITRLSLVLATQYVANDEALMKEGKRPKRDHDIVLKNSKMWLRDAFLYLDLCHAIRYGDVGAIEELIVPWTWLFSNCNKHKYATHLTRFILTLKHVYPPSLRNAIEMHWLCNLTGRPDGNKPIDWLREVDNCYEKCIFGPAQSNRTLPLLMKRSLLISVLRGVHTMVENNFHITSRTSRHAKPDMRSSIQRLIAHLEQHGPHEYKPGRGIESDPSGKVFEVQDHLHPHTIIGRMSTLFPKRHDLQTATSLIPDEATNKEREEVIEVLDDNAKFANVTVYD